MKLAAVVLSGGEGSRMQGQDKGLLPHQGEQMILHSLKLADQFATRVAISCNRNESHYAALGFATLRDNLVGYQGPLAGIHAAMKEFQQAYTHLLVLPCDTPYLSVSAVEKLLLASRECPDAICYLATEERPHFLHAVVPLALADSLQRWLSQGERAVYKWYRQFPCKEVLLPASGEVFKNINRPEDLKS